MPGVTDKFGFGVQNEAGQRQIELCQKNVLVIANTLLNNTREDSTHGHHQMVNTEVRLIIFFAAKDGEALLKLKKVGKTARPFRYDLNQILYDFIVEVTNRFKGLDLIDKVSEELWTEIHDTLQEAVIKIIPKKNKYKKAK